MPKASFAFTNFTAGEWGPQLDGRADLAKYRNAVRLMENFIIRPQGPATHRPGTRFVGLTKANQVARLIPFRFAADESLMLELSATALRFYCNNPALCPLPVDPDNPYARIDLPAAAATLSNGDFASGLDGWEVVLEEGAVAEAIPGGGLRLLGGKTSDGDLTVGAVSQTVESKDPSGLHLLDVALEGGPESRLALQVMNADDGVSLLRRVLAPGSHLIEIPQPDSGQYPPLLQILFETVGTKEIVVRSVDFTGNKPLEVPLPFEESELERVQFVQSADVVYFTHAKHQPLLLKRFGRLSWSVEPYVSVLGPFLPSNNSDTTLLADGRFGRVTITASSKDGINNGNGFLNGDEGRLIRLHDGFVRIVEVVDSQTVTGDVQKLEDGRQELMPFYNLSDGKVKFVEGNPDNVDQPHSDRLYDRSNKFLEKGFRGGMKLTLHLPIEPSPPLPPDGGDNTRGLSIGEVPDGYGQHGDPFLLAQVSEDTMVLSEGADVRKPVTGLWPDIADGFLVGELEASTDWALGLWSKTTGYPSTLTFFEDRLFFGGVPVLPQRIDGSRTGDYGNFLDRDPDLVVLADHAVAFTLSAEQINEILWLRSSDKGLLIGTTGGEWVMRPSDLNEALSPSNVVAKRTSTYGSAPVPPEMVANVALFLQRDRRKLREMAFVFEADGFKAPDMTILAEHVTESGIQAMAYSQSPDSVLWAVRNDGALLGFTYLRDQEVLGWHRHTLGGHADAEGIKPAVVESVAVIPSVDGSFDEVWLVVRRTINGELRRHVEVLGRPWPGGNNLTGALFSDSGRSLRVQSNEPVNWVGGLDHLEGQTVSLLIDGALHPQRQVTGGTVELERPITDAVIQAGLPRIARLETLRLEAGAADGTAQGKTKRITKVVFRLFETSGGKAGPSAEVLDPVPISNYRNPSTAMNSPATPFTGDSQAMIWPGGYETEGHVHFQQHLPLPATVVAIFPQVVTQDR
ncbi:hypothetical protein [Limibacillus sp. MBR-115]|jgi:hypothetical protein|uniref:hypothetical protein n=1 Tax=Limibacillus sp. MBR-115 TaxID=3156465 RepID=UPI0033967F21